MPFIYALCDPDSNKIRYIGSTVNPVSRYRNHISPLGGSSPKSRWIQKLAAGHKIPRLLLIEEVDNDDLFRAERGWIFEAELAGLDLLNVKDLTLGRGIFHPESLLVK